MSRTSGDDHHLVAVVVPGMSPLELAVASDFLGHGPPPGVDGPWYRFTVCTPAPGRVDLSGGISLVVDRGLATLRSAETIIIPGWCGRSQPPPPELVSALRRAHRRGVRIVSFCTGAFVLAHAGLLDGRRATTHWDAAAELADRFPAVDLDPTVLYVEDGGVWTSAGSAASIDCSLALVRHDHGAEVANALARDLVVPPHRDGGQAQFVAAPVAAQSSDEPLASTLDWAIAHLDQPLTVGDLADHANLSDRHFTRRFREVTGTTPLQWLLSQRILLAQRLLETTDLPVERVATDAGFGSAPALRMHFQRALHTSPLAYRRTFRAEPAAS
jgi:transcriptional regulator GlxA family with amidase domain